MRYGTVQISTEQRSQHLAIKYGVVLWSTVRTQYVAVQYSTVPFSTVHCSAIQSITVLYTSVQYNTLQSITVPSANTFKHAWYISNFWKYVVILLQRGDIDVSPSHMELLLFLKRFRCIKRFARLWQPMMWSEKVWSHRGSKCDTFVKIDGGHFFCA